jgi:outer membrane receptor protein involved in Fe transport
VSLTTGLLCIASLSPNALCAQEQDAPAVEGETMLEEVIVTAQRRGPERLQDVPMSISVVDRKSIARNGMVEMNDYLRALPSVSFIELGAVYNNIIIRGIATEFFWDDTTGVYIGETAVTRAGLKWSGAPDLKLVDIERIEVLRGPQGTLYGEGSMGGTVRIVPAAPNPARSESRVAGSFSVTGAEGGNNSTLEGMLNVPLLDGDAALRLVAYRHDNSGYYQNVAGSDPDTIDLSEQFGVPALNKSDVGATTFTGWRAQFLWQPTPELGIKFMALSQDVEEDGRPEADVGLERFQQARMSKFNGDGDTSFIDFDLTNLEVNYDFQALSLLSTTSLVESAGEAEATYPIYFDIFGYAPVFQQWPGSARSFSQELRLTSRQDGRLRYLAGFFYQDIESSASNILTYEGAPEFAPPEGATFHDALGEFDDEQTALFGELTYDLTDRITGTVGARWFQYDQELLWSGGGGVLTGGEEEYLPSLASGDGQTYSVKLEYEASQSTRIYGSFNQGFRFGGPAQNLHAICDADGDGIIDGTDTPMIFKIDSDTIDSYELGLKFRSSGGRFSVNASVFSVDWSDIPVNVVPTCNFYITVNAGEAESHGFEIEGAWEITEGLVLNYAASWMDPKLAEDSGDLGQAGDRLPGSPRHNLNLGIEQNFSIGRHNAFARADLVNVGEYYDNLQQMGEPSGGYTTIGARAGVSLDDWLVELYVHNLTDEFAITYYDWFLGAYLALRPRTVGVQVSYRFTGQ